MRATILLTLAAALVVGGYLYLNPSYVVVATSSHEPITNGRAAITCRAASGEMSTTYEAWVPVAEVSAYAEGDACPLSPERAVGSQNLPAPAPDDMVISVNADEILCGVLNVETQRWMYTRTLVRADAASFNEGQKCPR